MRKKTINVMLSIFGAVFLLYLAGCSSGSSGDSNTNNSDLSSAAEGEGKELNIALNAQPSTLDQHYTSSGVIRYVGRHIYETLLALNEDYEPVPELAESVDVSDDGLEYTIKLREGVKFHNGSEMKSEDAVASLERWATMNPVAKKSLEGAKFSSEDDYTFIIELDEPTSELLDLLAAIEQPPSIMPKEILDEAGSESTKEYIGTGPFKFEDWKPDQEIVLSKFEDYQPLDSPASGATGKKEALVDKLNFEIVTDASTRLMGVETGQYDSALGVAANEYEDIKESDDLKIVQGHSGPNVLIYNKEQGPTSNKKMRQAINAALDMEPILESAWFSKDLYTLDHTYLGEGIAPWNTETGKDEYNQADPEKARKLAKEAGYNGEEIIFLTSRDYPDIYNPSVVIQEQLKEAGINVKLDIYDWPTLTDRWNDPSTHDIHITGPPSVSTPVLFSPLSPDSPGWTDDEKVRESLENISRETDQGKAFEIWEELHEYLWTDYMPLSVFGHYDDFYVTTKNVDGVKAFHGTLYWNTTVSH